MFCKKIQNSKIFSIFFDFLSILADFCRYPDSDNTEKPVLPVPGGNGKNPEKKIDIFGIWQFMVYSITPV